MNAGMSNEFRNAMAKIERVSHFRLTRFRELFSTEPYRALENAAWTDQLRNHGRFAAPRLTRDYDNVVRRYLRRQLLLLDSSGQLKAGPDYRANALDVVAGDCFNLLPVVSEIRMVLQLEVRPESEDQLGQIKISAGSPVFGS